MIAKLFGLLLFWGVGIFALREAWSDYKNGFGYLGRGRWPHRERERGEFRYMVAVKVIGGLAFLIAGVVCLLFDRGN